jgi:hypothetical protein
MYLDDGLGGADTFEKCKDVSLVVKNDLFNLIDINVDLYDDSLIPIAA